MGENFTNTTLDDEAATAIADGHYPYTGSFRPAGMLSAVDAESPNGTWTLQITDTVIEDSGTLQAWSLSVTSGEQATSSDGSGNYSFALTPGTYNLRQLAQSDTIPITSVQTVTLSAGQSVSRNFGAFPIIFNGSGGNDSYNLSKLSGGGTEQILESLSGGPATPYTIATSLLGTSPLAFNTGDGDDTLTIDNSNGTPITSGGVSFTGGSHSGGGDALVVQGSAGADTVSIGSAAVSFGGSISYAGVETIDAITGGGNDTLNFNGPLAALVLFNGGTGQDTLNVNSGTYTLNSDANVGTASLSINAASGASVVFNQSQHLAALNLMGTASAVLSQDGGRFLNTRSLILSASAKLDLADNDFVLEYGTNPIAFADVQALVFGGFSASPDPGKTGIISQTSQNNSGSTILALFDNAIIGTSEWPPGSGQTISNNSVVGKYTYFGDVNLDGQVTGDDYGVIDANLNSIPDSGVAWLAGDANLDGQVTGDDYGVIDANLGLGSAMPLAPGVGGSTSDLAAPLDLSSFGDSFIIE